MNEFGIVKPASSAVVIDGPAECHSGELTAVVTGLPFSGTSMVAVVVDALGVPIIRDAAFPFAYEADEFNNVDMNGLRRAVERHNAERAVWGYKDPHARRLPPDEMHAALRNPHYVIVTKDLASMTARHVQNPIRPEDGKPPMERFRFVAAQHLEFIAWVLRIPPAPKLLVSYHAVLRDTAAGCRLIAEFLHLTPAEEQLRRAVARVSPTGGYLTKEDGL
jgi:hypothetical protein